MSTDTPEIYSTATGAKIDQHKRCGELERENARLREEVEMLNVRHAAAMLHAQTHADEYNALREELAEAKGSKPCCQDWDNCTERCIPLQQEWRHRAEQAEARSLEYKTEHAALLGTSQWQETEIADLRDDVKRLMQKDVLAALRDCSPEAITAMHDAMATLPSKNKFDRCRALRSGLLAMLDQFELDQFELDQGSAT